MFSALGQSEPEIAHHLLATCRRYSKRV